MKKMKVSARARRLVKAKYGDMILFYRVADAHRAYDADASIVATVVGVSRLAKDMTIDVGRDEIEDVIGKLVDAGHKVGIAERTGGI